MNAREKAKELRQIVERFFHGEQTSEHMYAMLESLERKATSALTVPEGCFDVLTKEHQNALDIAISRTPSGPDRNALTDISIVLMAALAAKKEPA